MARFLMIPQFLRHRWLSVLVALGLFASWTPEAQAIVDDAHSAAMALAASPAAKGFRLREDYWKGESKAGQSRQIKAQLFKGNEYWFWAGLDADEGVSVTITIADTKGKVLQVETSSGDQAAGARISPPKSGTYIVTITIKGSSADLVPWAVAYGYK